MAVVSYIPITNKLNEINNRPLTDYQIKNIILPSVVNYCQFAENQSNEFVKNGGSGFLCPTCRHFSSDTSYLLDSIIIKDTTNTSEGSLQIKTIIYSVYGRNDRGGQFQGNFTISKEGVVTSKSFSGANCIQ